LAEWTIPALADFTAAMEHIAAVAPDLAGSIASRVHAAVARLEQFPGLGTPGRRKGTRELVLPRIPYVIVYRESPGIITILRFLHTSRIRPLQ